MRRYTPEQKEWLRTHIKGRTTKEITALFNKAFNLDVTEGTIKSYKQNNKILSGTPTGGRQKYTKKHVDFLRAHVEGRSEKELRDLLNKAFNLDVTENAIANLKHRYGLKSGTVGGRFERGGIPANKGKKWDDFMSPEGQAASRRTTFKTGQTPKNRRSVGSTRVDIDGYQWTKIKDPGTWRPTHVLLWEQAHGSVKPGHCIIFLDGDKTNLALDNLAEVSRATNAQLNKHGLRSRDAELTKTGVLVAEVMTQLGRVVRKTTAKETEHD